LQSFVVQNFYTAYIVNERSSKSLILLVYKFRANIIWLLCQNLNLYKVFGGFYRLVNFFFCYFTVNNIFKYFSLSSTAKPLNNLTKSVFFWVLHSFTIYLSFSKVSALLHKNFYFFFIPYFKPIKFLSLFINKGSVLDLFILYLFSKVTSYYAPVLNNFVILSKFLLYSTNFNFFLFTNLFYLRLKHV
jgi:hypothetical protein